MTVPSSRAQRPRRAASKKTAVIEVNTDSESEMPAVVVVAGSSASGSSSSASGSSYSTPGSSSSASIISASSSASKSSSVRPAKRARTVEVQDEQLNANGDAVTYKGKGKGKMMDETGNAHAMAIDIKGKGKMLVVEDTTVDDADENNDDNDDSYSDHDITPPPVKTTKAKSQSKAALAQQSAAAAQRDMQERMQTILPYLRFPSKTLGADAFEEDVNDDDEGNDDNENADNSWWWKTYEEMYPQTSFPRPGLIFLAQITAYSYTVDQWVSKLPSAESQLPVEVIRQSEYQLKTRRPCLKYSYPYHAETVIVTHPDPTRRNDPTLTPSDFPEDEKYARAKALSDKELALQELAAPQARQYGRQRVQIQHEIVATHTHALVCKPGDKPILVGNWGFDDYVVDSSHQIPTWHPFLRLFVDTPPRNHIVHVQVFVDHQRLREVMERGESVQISAILQHDLLSRLRTLAPTKYTIPNTLSAPELEPVPGFGLELRPYQKRTLKWLVDLESDASQRTFMSLKDPSRRYAFESHGIPRELKSLVSLPGETPDAPCRTYLQFGPGGVYLDLPTMRVWTEKPTLNPHLLQEVKCHGAILADNTGTGKTVTVLALIHSNPFKCVPAEVYERLSDPLGYLPSRATLVVCPSHLAQQWKLEAQRCLPSTTKIHQLTTISDYKKMSWDDFLSADLIITSLHFLQNASYKTHMQSLRNKYKVFAEDEAAYVYALRASSHAHFGKIKGEAMLSRILWHRVVSDEFHELGNNDRLKKASLVFMNDLVGCFNLGVTGTPQYNNVENITSMAQYLGTDLPPREEICHNFLRLMVRRNEPELQLPPLVQQSVYVDLTPQERGMCQGLGSCTIDALMACNHHQLAGEILAMVGDQHEMTIDEVSRRVQVARQQRIAECEQDIVRGQLLLQQYRQDLGRLQLLKQQGVEKIMKNEEERSVKNEIACIERRLESTKREMIESQRELAEVRGQYNFFKAVLDTMQGNEEKECPICMDTIGKDDNFVISGCGHVHCVECMNQRLQSASGGDKPLCSMCRQEIKRENVMLMNRATMAKQKEKAGAGSGAASADSNQLDCSKYGSKLAAFVDYMRETLAATPTAKFILFIQFKRLMKLVSEALKEFRIEHVRCDGNVNVRSKAVREFKTSQNVRLILLSSEDSVSGLHLTEATHMVIFHPFLIPGNDALAVSYEKQGIARAWRGGLDHPVQLVRFIAKDSIEETLAKERGYVDGVVTELDGCVKKGEGSGGTKSDVKV